MLLIIASSSFFGATTMRQYIVRARDLPGYDTSFRVGFVTVFSFPGALVATHHGVRLPRSRLSVRKDACVVPAAMVVTLKS